MKNKTIFLCSSMNFYKAVVEIEEKLLAKGWTVNIPVSAQIMKKSGDFEVANFKEVITREKKAEFIHKNFDKIAEGDAILVVNNKKNGVNGYIGANVLMEIALAFYFKKKIYVWNPIPKDAAYEEEFLSFSVTVINQDLDLVK